MEQILFILFGWLLGLLSPVIVAKINSEYSKKQFFVALCAEIYDLQYRIAVVSFLLGQRFGELNMKNLKEIEPIIKNYNGNEKNENISNLIDSLLKANKEVFKATIIHMRAETGVGLGLKTFSPSFLDSNMTLVSKLPISLQSSIHEFKNHLNIFNQEVLKANDDHKMTFDSSLSDENHERLTKGILEKYAFIQGVSLRVVSRIEVVLSSKI